MATNQTYIDFSPLTPIKADWLNNVNNTVNYTPLGGVLRNLTSKLADTYSLKDFGAKLDGITDDTAAVNAAFASGETQIYSGFGTCLLNGTVTVSTQGFSFIGAGRSAFTFSANNTTLPAISVNGFLTGIQLSGFSITRIGGAITGGDGIQWLGSNSQGVLDNIHIQNCYRGFALGATDFSMFTRCVAEKNLNDGVQLIAPVAGGNLQWNTNLILSAQNVGRGFAILTQGGGSASTGTMTGLSTFANSNFGFAAIANNSGSPIQGLRINNCFFGQDGNHEIYLDTYGTQHVILNTFLELVGTAATGPTLATPASQMGDGVFITANNSTVELSNVHSNQMSGHGLATSGKSTVITGGAYTNNGLFVTPSFGILCNAGSGGRLIASGSILGNTGDDALTQKYGVFGDNGANTSIGFCDLTGNVTAAFSANSNVSSISNVGNLPSSIVNSLPAAIALSGTNYTNP